MIGQPSAQADALVMSRHADDARARAEARFNRDQQRSRQDEALKAGIAAQDLAVDKKTARLKELRLAKEAADKDAGEGAKPAPAKPARASANMPDGGHARQGPRKHQPPLVADPEDAKGG